MADQLKAEALIIGGKYNWKNQPERLIYMGLCEPRNGHWHQFALIESPTVVWCEVLPDDLDRLEVTQDRAKLVSVSTVQAGDERNAAIEQCAKHLDLEAEAYSITKDKTAEALARWFADDLRKLKSAAPSQPVADHNGDANEMIKIEARDLHHKLVEDFNMDDDAGSNWLARGYITDAIEACVKSALTTANDGKDATPTYTAGHCEHNKQPGGCQQHNLHCGWPKCDQKEINHA